MQRSYSRPDRASTTTDTRRKLQQRRALYVGDRVRAKVRTIFGWRGTGTVILAAGNLVEVLKDDAADETVIFCRHQLAKTKTR
jgi:hypothetical protein